MKRLLKNKSLILILIILLVIPVGITFSKYIKKFLDYYIMRANNFYFNSDKLGDSTLLYEVNNWSGVGNFDIQFQLNNHKNNILTSDSDISYEINMTCSSDVICSLSSTNGTIYKEEKTDNFNINIVPQRVFDTGEEISVYIEAKSTFPYKKTLSAEFLFKVGKKGISYEITDEYSRAYMDLIITNALDEYKVNEAFSTYHVGDIISTDTYINLSDEDKTKCYSASITLTFDPHDILLDVTNNILKSAITTTTRIDNVDYISSITFTVDAMSSTQIRFYKQNVSNDYSYPFGTEEIIDFVAS